MTSTARVITDSISPNGIRFTTLVITLPHDCVEEVIKPRELCYSTDITVNAVGWLPSAPRAFVMSSTKWRTIIDLWLSSSRQTLWTLAARVSDALAASKPTRLEFGEWHLPFVNEADGEAVIRSIVADAPKLEFDLNRMYALTLSSLQRVSAARCMTLGRTNEDTVDNRLNQDLKIFSCQEERSGMHLLGFMEHQATPDYTTGEAWRNPHLHGQATGWCLFSQIHPWDKWRARPTA